MTWDCKGRERRKLLKVAPDADLVADDCDDFGDSDAGVDAAEFLTSRRNVFLRLFDIALM
jgi:hypothetical protein